MWNLKCDPNELIYETETKSGTQRIYWWLPKGRVGVGVWDQQMQVGVYRTDKQ